MSMDGKQKWITGKITGQGMKEPSSGLGLTTRVVSSTSKTPWTANYVGSQV
jgi:hypothetical protein